MNVNASDAVLQALAVAMEVCGAQPSKAALAVMLEDLADFPEADVIAALKRVRRELTGRFSLAAILERIPGGQENDEAKTKDAAALAWESVVAAVRSGRYRTGDALTDAVIRRVGGEPRLCDMGDANRDFIRRDFLAMYTTYANANPHEYRASVDAKAIANGRQQDVSRLVRDIASTAYRLTGGGAA